VGCRLPGRRSIRGASGWSRAGAEADRSKIGAGAGTGAEARFWRQMPWFAIEYLIEFNAPSSCVASCVMPIPETPGMQIISHV
jgi:hypothetical protein